MKGIIIGIIIIVVIILVFMLVGNNKVEENSEAVMTDEEKMMEDDKMEGDKMMEGTVKEFSTDSFVEFVDEQPKPQFSVRELAVKKGDTVKIMVSVTAGIHDFKIDEFDVFSATPTGETTLVEFVASEAGEFIYYCNQPGHRDLGHWGTLTVTE